MLEGITASPPFSRKRRMLGALLLVTMVLGGQAHGTEEAAGAVRSLAEYRHRTHIPIFDPRKLAVRWVSAIVGIERAELQKVARNTREPALLIWRENGALVCDCATSLLRDEAPVSAEPITDRTSGLIVSIDETTYRTLAVQMGYPLTAVQPIAAAMANLAYVGNAEPLRAYLDEQGFTLDYAYGMANAGGPVNPRSLHFFVAHQKSTGDAYIAVRGTSDLADMITNFSTEMVPWLRGGQVHEGYEAAAEEAAALVRPAVEDLKRRQPGRSFYATGHSLGAAIASLISLNLVDLAPVHTLALAIPPLGNASFKEREAAGLARVDSYFVAHDEIRSLERVARSRSLEWVGRHVDLGDIGQTAGSYHLVINYMKGMLAIRDMPVVPFERAVPICTLRVLPCFRVPHAVLPLCVFDDPACVARSWPAMAAWIDHPHADPVARRAAARRLQRDLVEGKFPDDLHPFVFAELAAHHGSSDPVVGLRFLEAAHTRFGDGWLLRYIRERLDPRAAAAS